MVANLSLPDAEALLPMGHKSRKEHATGTSGYFTASWRPAKVPLQIENDCRMGAKLRDRDVRKALKSKLLREHIADPRTLVLDELGLRHGACRVDIAVVNGSMHGYEIKSDSDTLERLPSQ